MSEAPKKQSERFTMLEPRGPNTMPPGSENWPVVELQIKERFTMLEPVRANNPSPEEVPPAVLNLVAELAKVVDTLDAGGRAAALAHISAKFPKRTAG